MVLQEGPIVKRLQADRTCPDRTSPSPAGQYGWLARGKLYVVACLEWVFSSLQPPATTPTHVRQKILNEKAPPAHGKETSTKGNPSSAQEEWSVYYAG